MVKGTPSMGKKARAKLHIKCRRCGQTSFHKKKRICSYCGYGSTSKLRKDNRRKKHYFKKYNNAKGFRNK